MPVVVTGATGQLGHLVVEALLSRGFPAGQIVATGRKLDQIKGLADRGVRTLSADFNDPASLRAAFEGAEKVLLISSSEVGQRVTQHGNVIEAARAAGVGLIAYTSVAGADTTTMRLAEEHKATEALLRESGLAFSLLRNGWYLENYTGQLSTTVQIGTIYGSAGDGRVSAASRADFAEAAAAVLLADDQGGTVYELGGDTAFTMSELAAEISAQTGTAIGYTDLPQAEYQQVLIGAGLPEGFAAVLADTDRAIAAGELQVTSGDLGRLIGRATTTVAAAVTAARA